MIDLRREQPQDAAAIREVERLAFGHDAEADLVDALRDAGAWALSLVAVEIPQMDEAAAAPDLDWAPGGGEGRVEGHVLFTRVTVATPGGDEMSLLGLGPVAVAPWRRGEGIGTMLIEAGLELMRGGAYPAVVVVGSPKYYARFGFLPASQWGLHYVGDASEDDLMAVELSPGSLAGIRGLVRFRPEFAGIQALRMTGQP